MSDTVLVACVGKKLDRPAQARDLYQSAWFKKARLYAERFGNRWYILSAKYGLLSPVRVIEPYDMTLGQMTIPEREVWAGQVFDNLVYITDQESDYLTFLAGLLYREPLVSKLVLAGSMTRVPMRGLGIGQQLQWLNERLRGTGGIVG